MPEPDFLLKQHDTSSPLNQTLEDSAGVAVNITGAAVRFLMRPINGTTNKVNAAANIISGAAGTVRYNWQTADVDTAGLFIGEWQVTFGGGSVQTFPNGGYTLILISPDLGS